MEMEMEADECRWSYFTVLYIYIYIYQHIVIVINPSLNLQKTSLDVTTNKLLLNQKYFLVWRFCGCVSKAEAEDGTLSFVGNLPEGLLAQLNG